MRLHFAESIQLHHCTRILEVGCGSGAVLTDWAKNPAEVHGLKHPLFIGLDLDIQYLRLLKQSHPTAEAVCGDGFTLPFPDETFDLTYCHYLLLWVEEPRTILTEMIRVTREGGWVAAFAEPDYGGRIDYPPELSQLGKLQTESLQEQGANPFIGRELRALFVKSGLKNIRVGVLAGEWSETNPTDQSQLEWEVLLADIGTKLPPEALDPRRGAAYAAWMRHERIVFIPTFYAWGQKLSVR